MDELVEVVAIKQKSFCYCRKDQLGFTIVCHWCGQEFEEERKRKRKEYEKAAYDKQRRLKDTEKKPIPAIIGAMDQIRDIIKQMDEIKKEVKLLTEEVHLLEAKVLLPKKSLHFEFK